MAVGFFDMFFDSEYRQRGDINTLQMTEGALESDVVAMSERIRALRMQVNDLSLTVAVLVKMLQEQNVVDPKVLHYRVEAELDALRPPPQQLGARQPVPDVPVTCERCGTVVPSSKTTITAAGTLCDKCAGL